MREFKVDDEPGRREWRQLLLTLEKRIALACKYRGMLADDLSDYLWERSSGRMGSLMPLIARGCNRAVRGGAEILDQEPPACWATGYHDASLAGRATPNVE
jgi:hypothetical protein